MESEYNNSNNFDTEDDDNRFDNIAIVIIFTGYIISIPFLLIIFVVYSVIPELMNIHGQTIRGYVGCRLVLCTVLLIFVITEFQGVKLPGVVYVVFIYFAQTGSFIWLNVMCFDIWWTFGGFRRLKISRMHRERKKFVIYSCWVWGWTILLTSISTIIDFGCKDEGSALCSRSNDLVQFGPITATLFFNMIFFVLTITKMIRHNKNTSKDLEGTESRRQNNNKQWFFLYLKLFVVMGFGFLSDLIMWLQSSIYIDFCNRLIYAYESIFIFVMLICKKNILRLLKKRFRSRRENSFKWSSRSGACRNSVSRNSTTFVPSHEIAERF